MPSKTKIEYADYISNPIKARYRYGDKQGHACVRISGGCAHCWASTFNMRLGTGLEYSLPNMEKVEMFLDDKELERLLTFKPRGPFKNGRDRALVFPFDMTDLFGRWVPGSWIGRIFNVMEARPDVDFLILTKRAEKMEEYLSNSLNGMGPSMKNVYLGVSIENKAWGEQRMKPMLHLHSMGWKTVVSYEPAIGPVDWLDYDFIDWLICGGESGHGARPMHPDWARSARDFCQANRIPFFFKQWGEWVPLDHLPWVTDTTTFATCPIELDGAWLCRVGKGLAGHVLDGCEWKEMPNIEDASQHSVEQTFRKHWDSAGKRIQNSKVRGLA